MPIFRLRHNGNMPAVRAPRHRSRLEKTSRPSKSTMMVITPMPEVRKACTVKELFRLNHCRRILGGCLKCMAMCGNGAPTGMKNTPSERKSIHLALPKVMAACCVAVLGTLTAGTRVPLTAAGSSLTTATTPSGFAWPQVENSRQEEAGRPQISRLRADSRDGARRSGRRLENFIARMIF